MGINKQEFITVRMSNEVYNEIDPCHRAMMEKRNVDESGWEEAYKLDQQWLDRKNVSDKAFRELKKREFEIRNK